MAETIDIKQTLASLSKLYEGVPVFLMGDDYVAADVQTIDTGSLLLNRAIGAGGFVRGMFNSVYGWESSTKTSLALMAIANAQKEGGYCAYIDAEQALKLKWAQSLGVDTNRLVLTQPDSAEQSLNIAREMIQSNTFDVIVLDSIAALAPEDELEEGIEKNSMGVMGRFMSKFFRSNIASLRKANAAFITINQFRNKMVMFGDDRALPGGNAEKFYAGLRIEAIKNNKPILNTAGEPIGLDVTYKIIKSKVGVPYKEVKTKFLFGRGIWVEFEVLELALAAGVIIKKGSWYSYKDANLAQGEHAVLNLLMDNPDLFDEIKQQI